MIPANRPSAHNSHRIVCHPPQLPPTRLPDNRRTHFPDMRSGRQTPPTEAKGTSGAPQLLPPRPPPRAYFRVNPRYGRGKSKKERKGSCRLPELWYLQGSHETTRSAGVIRTDCDGNDHNRVFCPPETFVLCSIVHFNFRKEPQMVQSRWHSSSRENPAAERSSDWRKVCGENRKREEKTDLCAARREGARSGS